MPQCNSLNFQIFLDLFSKTRPDELKVIVLDNGAFHKAQVLVIPENIILIFLPPYSPELNPAENMWARFKRNFTNRLFKTLDELEVYMCDEVNKLTQTMVKQTCAFSYVFEGHYWSIV